MTRLSTLITIGTLLSGSLYLSSYSSGPVNSNRADATSSGLGSTKCGSCHRGGNFGTKTSVQLLNAAGDAVTTYVGGQTYQLRFDIATSTTPAGYGLQALLVDTNRAQAGSFSDPSADLRLSTLNSRTYVEHRRRMAAAQQAVTWTAPPRGTGKLTLYAVGNAVNGNGGTGGDLTDEAIVEIAEDLGSAVGELRPELRVDIWSPAAGRLSVRVVGEERPAGVRSLRVLDVGGRLLQQSGGLAGMQVYELAALPAGIVLVEVRLTDGTASSQLAWVQ